MDVDAYSSSQVTRIIGVTYRQLDYWDRCDFIKPSKAPASGYGSGRLYSFQDLVKLKVAKRLKDAGVGLQRIRKALDYLGDHCPELQNPLLETVFFTDGRELFVVTSDPTVMIDVLKGGQFSWCFNLKNLAQEVRSSSIVGLPNTVSDEASTVKVAK